MRRFLDRNFLLRSPAAEVLYHEFAAEMPIIDYHCHLPAEDIADDRRFENLTQAWLEGDHYKWRAMRMNGIEEHYCTGSAADRDKFDAWARTVPQTIMNPLYHWTHLELRRYFGIEDILDSDSSEKIFDRCTELLRTPDYSCRALLERMKVRVVCTTNDPIEDLSAHTAIAEEGGGLVVVPGFRADRASQITDPGAWLTYISALGEAARLDITSPDNLLEALQIRHDFFAECGCVVSDHGEELLYAEDYNSADIKRIFASTLRGIAPPESDVRLFKSWLLYELAIMDHAAEWTQQFHLSALRNNNSRAPKVDSGYDSIGDFAIARGVASFLDRLNASGQLARTMLYSVNPAHNEVLASMCGNFCEHPTPAKVQFGTAWWFMDQIDGMERQLTAFANMGLLSHFVGMLTDSRSFLSFPRHEYFRRILCNMVGTQVDRGEIPHDLDWLGQVVQNICYTNAQEFFRFRIQKGSNTMTE
ncbi:MAG: glucuronate isomerase [Rhodothermaceae bacterium]|nr:glucuronate isomerase [Rhodothermaceae bacterium]MXX57866.1 glucuronate isomerase [Rhodothermaceae bacterium]MYD18070.1 glucuronate isomerase [Rhodothermaceae bacterium]MYD57059.1 glucuronate isomerase [Rhodothermaceae bacterium]MYI43302.1 glucuronate isomerase [Rhodothermaceae bacterium]